MLLYDKVADDLVEAISRGTLRPGDRMPSVRGLASQRGVSVATVIQAYVRLENDGVIEVRPRSGHFVRARTTTALEEPRSPRRSFTAARVSVTPGVQALMGSMRDPNIVPLGAAQVSSDLLPIAQLNRMLAAIAREMQSLGGSYGDPLGVPTLRRQLAKRSVAWGVSLVESEFLITIGAMEGLTLCLRAVANPGDAIAVESPTYFGVLQAIEQLGMRAVEVPALPRTGLDLDALESVLKQGGVRAVLASPNVSNPLGAIMPDAAKERLVRMCSRFDVPLIEDDVYGELAFEGRPPPALAWDKTGHVLLVGSVSKTLAPGYRIGWVVGGRYQERIARLKYSLTVATPAILQMPIAEFLANGGYDRHLRRLRAHLRNQTDRTRDAIAASFPTGTRVTAPAGGFVLWLELPVGVDAYTLQAEALQQGVSIAPRPHLLGPRAFLEPHSHLVWLPLVAARRVSRQDRRQIDHGADAFYTPLGVSQLDLFPPPPLEVSSDAELAPAKPAHVRLGTSSWTFRGWAGIVYRGKPTQEQLIERGLEEYAQHPLFSTVGIDRSFYAPLSVEELQSYARQLPRGFQCVIKVWNALTTPVDQRTRQPNPQFLDPAFFKDAVLAPIDATFSAHAGPLVFQFPPSLSAEIGSPSQFTAKLDRFLSQLPKHHSYAVELRSAELFTPAYLATLARHGVAHVLNHWERMPSLRKQLSVNALTAKTVVCRLLLPQGVGYEEAREAFAPFDRIQAPDEEMREDVAELVNRCAHEARSLFIIVNNKAEGSSPLTVRALLERIAVKR